MPVLCASLISKRQFCVHKNNLFTQQHTFAVRLVFNLRANTCVSSPFGGRIAFISVVCSGCDSLHCMISPRSAKFGTSFLFGSLALEIGSVCLARSHRTMHSRS